MKKTLFTLLMILTTAFGMSQTIGEAFYVYRNDGMINTFFRSEIDSIAYSYYDADSLLYEEIVSQVVYTPDSIYQIPLAVIDSVGFVTPKTEYQPDVISLEGAIRDYVIGSDSLTIYFRSNTPFNILPKTGDKLVTTEISDVFWGGFLGKVVGKEEKGDTIALHCDAIDLEEAYKCFYYSISGAPQSDFNKSRAKGLEWEGYYAPDPFVYSSTNFLKTFFQPINCPITFTPKFEISIAPTFGSKGSIIVHPLRGVVISMDIHQHTSFAEDLAVSGEIGLSKDISLIPGPIPMYPILPFVSIYGDLGVVFKANGKLTLEEHWGQSLDFDIHYEASYQPLLPMTISTSIPKLKISNVNFTTEHNGKFMFEGSGAFGGYGEIGIVPWLLKKVAKVGFRFEGGLKLEGNVMLYNSDGEGALQSTSLYDKLRAGTLSLKSFCSVGMDAKLIGVGTGGVNFYDNEWPLAKYKIVPDFTNTTLKRDVNNSLHTIEATTTACGETLIPCSLGFRLFESGGTESFKGPYTYQYWGLGGKPETYSDFFFSLPLSKSYIVYPTVELFGIEMLAEPSAEVGLGATPITLEASDISDTTAKVWGKIFGHELLNESVQFGLGFYEVGTTTYFEQNASTIDEDGKFSVEFVVLKPNTTYKYYAYLIVDEETYYGEEKEFTTKRADNWDAYCVWDNTKKTLTYYYDEMRKERGGDMISREYDIPYYRYPDLVKVIFDSTFSYYYPTKFRLQQCENLESIENINYLNTDSISDMSWMFFRCKSLNELDLSSFNTSNVTNMSSMFWGCNSLTSLDVSSFNTSNVITKMDAMFYYCNSLTSLDLTSFDTSNVPDMSWMFAYCSSLKSLDISSFNTSNVTFMGGMFYLCNSLTSLDISNFDTSNVKSMSSMFSDCCSLSSIDVSNFNTSNVTNSIRMFRGCSSLTTIYGGNWNVIPEGYEMFTDCNNLVGGQGTKLGYNLYGYDDNGNPLYYLCGNSSDAAHIDGGKDNPGLFTVK